MGHAIATMNRFYLLLLPMALLIAAHGASAQTQPGNVVVHADPRLLLLNKHHSNTEVAPPTPATTPTDNAPEKRPESASAGPVQQPGITTAVKPKPTPTNKGRIAAASGTATLPAQTTSPAAPATSAAPHTKAAPYLGKGYRVQLYNGPDRNKAYQIKADFAKKFPGVRTYLSYVAPGFRVKAGDFRTRAEAVPMLQKARCVNTTVMIVPDDIAISGF